jgi:hypothetical protein
MKRLVYGSLATAILALAGCVEIALPTSRVAPPARVNPAAAEPPTRDAVAVPTPHDDPKDVHVQGYYRNGKWVQPYDRHSPRR